MWLMASLNLLFIWITRKAVHWMNINGKVTWGCLCVHFGLTNGWGSVVFCEGSFQAIGTRIKRRALPGHQHPEPSSASYQHPVSHTTSILAQENKDRCSCSLPAVLMQPGWWRLLIITSQGHSNQCAKHSSSQPRCTDETKVCREENKHGDKRERSKLQIRRWNREEPRGWNKFRLRFLTHHPRY